MRGKNSIRKHETISNGSSCNFAILHKSALRTSRKSYKSEIFLDTPHPSEMQQTNGMTTVINQEQSDLVTSATLSANGNGAGPKDSIKNVKTVIIASTASNITKTKITTIINSNNSSKSSNNNNNSTTTNKNSNSTSNNISKPSPNGRSDLQHKINATANNASTTSSATSETSSNGKSANQSMPDARQVLKEAVDAVVNSFTKHTQGYGRGEFSPRS